MRPMQNALMVDYS